MADVVKKGVNLLAEILDGLNLDGSIPDLQKFEGCLSKIVRNKYFLGLSQITKFCFSWSMDKGAEQTPNKSEDLGKEKQKLN